ncbi:hypothetical protein NLJ89_g8926 [Agrocybe chaxingu]|uniref:Protein kinase domain-containing protein n=1 Tax=Agrocybe chaxingu TaxID=84603 RepID=A0A9W8JTG0_9AGAR|nr:hypothetical protein NLJ89_g8926 [Agrocybe chaxingu]
MMQHAEMSWSKQPDSIADAVKELLHYNYDEHLTQSNEEDVSPSFPLTFYDRHIDSRLRLKTVKLLPEIVKDLAEICHGAVAQMLNLDKPDFSKYSRPAREPPIPFDNSHSVYAHYYQYVNVATSRFVSKLYIHPKDRGWESCLGFQSDENTPGNPAFAFNVLQGFSFSCKDPPRLTLSDEVFNNIPTGRRQTIIDLTRMCPVFAVWQFFSMTPAAEKLLEKMCPTSCFKSVIPTTSGLAPFLSSSPPVDSVLGLADLVTNFEARQYQLRSRTKKTNDDTGAQNSADIVVPQCRRSAKVYTPKPEHFIQCAWNRAVVNDASFLLFHCGTYQRIGYRHRESQTLYLSELIDTRDSDPPYGTIQMGFHLVGFQDAVGRKQATMQRERVENNKKRRSEDSSEDDPRRSKRQCVRKAKAATNTGATLELDEDGIRELVQAAMASCEVALVRLNYDHYRSPAPSAFVRVRPSCAPGSFNPDFKPPKRRTKYLPTQCFSATVTAPPLGYGAVGVVHRLTVEVDVDSQRFSSDFLIKFAFTPRRQAKLRNEYAIYEHLAGATGVEGVVLVHGLFEDVESSVLAIIMNDGGTSLREREIARGSTREAVVVTDAEKTSFKRSLKSIHRADVRHRDLRPENMLINSKGETYFIDFDLAEVTKGRRC